MSKIQGESVEIQNFEPFLQKWLNCKQLKLVDFVAKTMLPLGENYCSEIVKIDATIRRTTTAEEETLYFVVKTPNFVERPIINWSDVFLKEVFMYTVLIPAFKKLEQEFEIKSLFEAYPKYIGHRCSLDDKDGVVDGHSMLVLENLKTRGFYNGDRRKGLDLEHSKKALSTLAKFHALGLVLMHKHPELVESIISQAQMKDCDFESIDKGLDMVLNTIRDNSNFSKHLQIIESTFAEARNGYIIKRKGTKPWLTITHGDFWVNNVMFHKDQQGRIDDVKLIDFQIYLYNSPLKDLPAFLCCSVDEATRTNNLDDLIDHYYETFIETLKCFNYDIKPFNREEFDKELKQQAIIQFPGCALALKFFAVEIKEEHKRSTIINDIFNENFDDEILRQLHNLIDIYEKKKWF